MFPGSEITGQTWVRGTVPSWKWQAALPGLKLSTGHRQPKLTGISLPHHSTGGHFVPGKHIPLGPGHWADFRRFLHIMHKHKYKSLKFLQKTGGRSKHFIKLELIMGLKGMSDGAVPREMLNICYIFFLRELF